MITTTETTRFSQRIQDVPRSFIRDILKVAGADNIISFAGGLPNKKFFPINELASCTQHVFSEHGQQALQYAPTEGLPGLREKIAANYRKEGLDVKAEQILITTGSQQALDLIGKVFINRGDSVLIEEPAYLGAIQAFSMYAPKFIPTELQADGINTDLFRHNSISYRPKLAYLVTNFQNPTGITYSEEKRKAIAEIAKKNNILLIEDNPYGQIKFTDDRHTSLYQYAPNHTILLGTFSKSVAPGFRIGWMVIPHKEMYSKIETAKQASDLHTDIFSQYIINQFLEDYGVENHLTNIINAYRNQSESMLASIKKHMPNVLVTHPKGGMFCWVELPDGYSSMQLFNEAIKNNVAFVPGVPFYIGKKDVNTLRLNFSCSESAEIEKGIHKLAIAMDTLT